MNPVVAVVILNYHNPKATQRALTSVWKSEGAINKRAIVVQTGEKEHSLSNLPDNWNNWGKIVEPGINLGFAGGMNFGIAAAREQWNPDTIVLLNDDAYLAPHSLAQLHETLHRLSRVGAVCPKIFFSKGHEYHPGYEKSQLGKVLWYAGGIIDYEMMLGFHRGVDEVDFGQYNQVEDTPFATGCCLALKPAMLDKVGIFDAKLFLYLEDVDLSIRMRKANWRILYEPRAVAWHDNAGSSGSGSDLQSAYIYRNRWRLMMKYGKLTNRLRHLRATVREWPKLPQSVRSAILEGILGRYGIITAHHRHNSHS